METYQNLVTQMEDMETMIDIGYEENDPALIPEIQEMLDEFQKDFDNIRIKTLLSGEYDSENAIIKLNAGAGGTEACDWCGMLYRMYSRWADKKGFTLEVLDYLDGDEAGIKSVTFQVNGTNAYGYLKSEKGVHRLVRISPFNAAGKRQTSFVSCDVMPDIKKDLISPSDICHLTADTGEFFLCLLLFEKIQLGFQHLHGFIFIHVLRTFILTLYHDSGRIMCDTDGR